MSYDQIDLYINKWSNKYSLTLFKEWNGGESRFAYRTNLNNECYQIYIREPFDGVIRVDISLVDSIDDLEVECFITAPISFIGRVLDKAILIVENGFF